MSAPLWTVMDGQLLCSYYALKIETQDQGSENHLRTCKPISWHFHHYENSLILSCLNKIQLHHVDQSPENSCSKSTHRATV
jgi:hypothetical protein